MGCSQTILGVVRRLSLLAAIGAAGCGAASPTKADLAAGDDPRACGPGIVPVANEGATHVTVGTAVAYESNPPASGSHWPFWEDWGVYFNRVVPRETWVHNLEHGGIVLLFNCPVDGGAPPDLQSDPDGGTRDGGVGLGASPCPELTDPLRALREDRALDRFKIVRVLVTRDPLLPTRVAAVAWNWAWTGDTVDVPTLRCFIDQRYDKGPESAP